MELVNYYTILKIDVSADLDTIKKAFRKEIALYHPDNNTSEGAKAHFDLLVEGFHILSNPERRNAYDKMLSTSKNDLPIGINEPIEEFQYKEWKKESKTKSNDYWDSSLLELLALDIFIEAGFAGLTFGAEELFDGLGDIAGDIFDVF
jgi:DnaJ-class molecular chaperone